MKGLLIAFWGLSFAQAQLYIIFNECRRHAAAMPSSALNFHRKFCQRHGGRRWQHLLRLFELLHFQADASGIVWRNLADPMFVEVRDKEVAIGVHSYGGRLAQRGAGPLVRRAIAG